MPRPSRNLDRALLAAGRALYPGRGCGGLAVREVAEAAGVNLGMFHYHFKSREAFLRAVLQSVYEEMYTQLVVEATAGAAHATPLAHLRRALGFMGRFVKANRPMLARVLADALSGEPIALEFVRANFPRHFGMIQSLVVAGQAAGEIRPLPVLQVMGFCAGSLAAPILFGGAAVESPLVPKAAGALIERSLLDDEAIDARIELALAAIALPAAPKTRRRPARRGKASP